MSRNPSRTIVDTPPARAGRPRDPALDRLGSLAWVEVLRRFDDVRENGAADFDPNLPRFVDELRVRVA